MSTIIQKGKIMTSREKLSGNALIAKITKVFVDAMLNDPQDWTKPWRGVNGMPHNPSSKTIYSGINSFWLMMHMQDGDPRFSTYKGWAKLGGQVRKGEEGIPVIYYSNSYVHKTTGKWVSGNKVPSPIENYEKRFVSRVYSVFHANQVDNAPVFEQPITSPDIDVQFHREWFQSTNIDWVEKPSDRAYYRLNTDQIVTPLAEQFLGEEEWFGTVAHEFCHATMHKSRLDRKAGNRSDDTRGYAEEELVAELGATFLAIQRGVESTPRQDHISYVQSWLGALDNDPKFIQKASSKAWKAAQWILENTTEPAREKELVA